MMKIRFLAIAALFGAAVLSPSVANATVFIGLQETGTACGTGGICVGTVTQMPDSDPSAGHALFAGTYGSFSLNIVSGTGSPLLSQPNLLNSTSDNLSASAPGTINIYVTSTDNQLPAPNTTAFFSSAFTSNSLPSGWTVTESTYLDSSNGKFTTSILLGTHLFSSIGTTTTSITGVAGAGLFSVTELYSVTATSVGDEDLSTIHLTGTVPEPASSLAFLGIALLGFGMIRPWWGAKQEISAFSSVE